MTSLTMLTGNVMAVAVENPPLYVLDLLRLYTTGLINREILPVKLKLNPPSLD